MPADSVLAGVTSWAAAARYGLPEPLGAAVERVKWSRRGGAARAASARRCDALIDPRSGAAARVLIGPANFAGQGLRWAQALGRAGVPAVCWAYLADDRFAFGADLAVPIGVQGATTAQQRTVFDAVARTVEAVVIEAGRPLFGALFGFDPVAEAAALADRGVRVALLWHGTDIRLPSAHVSAHPASPFRDPAHRARVRALQAVARRNRRRLARFDGPVLVSTADLVSQVPAARWCPVVVDLERWAASPHPERTLPHVPVVVHVPSNPWLKGSDAILRTLRPLADEGVIALVTAEDVPSGRMPDLLGRADVVVDQFGLGIYGVAACEAMALGAVLVSGIDQEVRDEVRRATGLELPAVTCAPDELAGVLRAYAAGPGPFDARAAAGPGFVHTVHDGRRSAQVLREALGLPGTGST